MAEKKTELAIQTKFDQLLIESKNQILQNTVKDKKQLDALLKVYNECKVTNIDSKAEADHIETGLKEVRKIRIAIDKNRKELTAPVTAYQKELIAYADEFLNPISETEAHLKAEKQKYDDLVEAEKNRLFTERAEILSKNGYQLVNGSYICGPIHVIAKDIHTLEQSQVDYYVELGKKEIARKEAEEKRIQEAEQRLKDSENALDLERQKMAKEREEMAKLKAELNAKLAELNAQEIAIEKTYDEVEKIKDKPVISQGAPIEEEAPEIIETPTVKKAEKPIETPKNDIGDIFEELTDYQKGRNDMRSEILDLLKNPASFDKKIINLISIVKAL